MLAVAIILMLYFISAFVKFHEVYINFHVTGKEAELSEV